jgi:hypothetical protein
MMEMSKKMDAAKKHFSQFKEHRNTNTLSLISLIKMLKEL